MPRSYQTVVIKYDTEKLLDVQLGVKVASQCPTLCKCYVCARNGCLECQLAPPNTHEENICDARTRRGYVAHCWRFEEFEDAMMEGGD